MIEFEDYLMNITAPEELLAQVDDDKATFYDFCKKVNITDTAIVERAAYECEQDEDFCIPEI